MSSSIGDAYKEIRILSLDSNLTSVALSILPVSLIPEINVCTAWLDPLICSPFALVNSLLGPANIILEPHTSLNGERYTPTPEGRTFISTGWILVFFIPRRRLTLDPQAVSGRISSNSS